MVLRWTASAFLATAKVFRPIQGYRDLWMLQPKLNDAVTGDDKYKVDSLMTRIAIESSNYVRDNFNANHQIC